MIASGLGFRPTVPENAKVPRSTDALELTAGAPGRFAALRSGFQAGLCGSAWRFALAAIAALCVATSSILEGFEDSRARCNTAATNAMAQSPAWRVGGHVRRGFPPIDPLIVDKSLTAAFCKRPRQP